MAIVHRNTSQRTIILDYLKSIKETDKHPTADDVYKKVRTKLPRISLGTVYRNLNFMKERGEIQEISGPMARYEVIHGPHAHFVCENCNKIVDLENEYVNKLSCLKTKVGKVKSCSIYLYGICNNCKK
ncbi:MAG: transcriptional repressor [bacterium]